MQIVDILRQLRRRLGHIRARCGSASANPSEAKITAVVYTVEPSYLLGQCLASIQTQSLPPHHIEIVRNVSPFPRAAQEGLNRVQTPFYVSVDDDMILDPHCFFRLHQLITQDDNRAEVILGLEDPILGSIFGVRIYRTAAVKPLGFFPLEEKGPERRMHSKLKAAGYECLMLSEVVGKHHPVYQPEELFWKYRFIGEKVRYYGLGPNEFKRHMDKLCEYWLRTKDEIAMYAFAGLFDGLQAEDVNHPLTYEGRTQNPVFLQLQNFLQRSAREP